ncbi:MAG: hypothetical protein IKE01_03370 [Clostridia bacterium]|nr:hypothetical protein [Clostridia bacterium]
MNHGQMDIKAIREAASKLGYRYGEQIINGLFDNKETMDVVYNFYRMQNPERRMETELPDTLKDMLYDSYDDIRSEQLSREIIKVIYANDIKQRIMDSNVKRRDVSRIGQQIHISDQIQVK